MPCNINTGYSSYQVKDIIIRIIDVLTNTSESQIEETTIRRYKKKINIAKRQIQKRSRGYPRVNPNYRERSCGSPSEGR